MKFRKSFIVLLFVAFMLQAAAPITYAAESGVSQTRATRYFSVTAYGQATMNVSCQLDWYNNSGDLNRRLVSFNVGEITTSGTIKQASSYSDSGIDWSRGMTLTIYTTTLNAVQGFSLYSNSSASGTALKSGNFVYNATLDRGEYINAYTWHSSQDLYLGLRLTSGSVPTPTPEPTPEPTPTRYSWDTDFNMPTLPPQSGSAVGIDDVELDNNGINNIRPFISIFWRICPWNVGVVGGIVVVGFFKRLLKG